MFGIRNGEACSKNQMRVDILRIPENVAKIKSLNMKPLEIEWLFGWNSKLGMTSISKKVTKNDNLLLTFFVSAQVCVILEYDTTVKSKKMKMLTGHRNCISSFDSDSSGRYFVTADKGKDSMIIVWDILSRIPIFTALSPFETGIKMVKFSMHFKYLITVSAIDDGEQTISIWDFKKDLEEPTHSSKLDKSFGPILHIAYCYNNPNFYCFTTENRIFFVTLKLLQNENQLIINIPEYFPKRLKYKYTQSIYVADFRQVVSATTAGVVTVWDDLDYNAIKMKYTPVTNDKQYLKSVQLDDYSIDCIVCHRDYIITGNTNGDVCFYDKSLIILYFLNTIVGESITSISMHKVTIIDEDKGSKVNIQDARNSKSRMIKPRKYNPRQIGITISATEEFICDPFFISISHADLLTKNSFNLNLTHTPYMILGNAIGELCVYNYYLKTLIARSATNSPGERVNKSQVTSIKYSLNGQHLCYGCTDGTFLFLNPRCLTPRTNASFKWNKSPVQHITFSDSSNYVVYTDNLHGIYLYAVTIVSGKFTVKYYGCYEVHTGTIRGISLAENETSLTIYSVGADHKIANFKLDKTSSEDGELPKLIKILKTEPQNEPQCMMKSTQSETNLMIISGSDFRLTLWDDNRCIQTTRGVNLESPIKIMKESSKDPSFVFFCTNTDIGLLRQPVDGNPYKNVAVLGSGTKIIDFDISPDTKFLFSINEDSSSVLMWSINLNCLAELEKHSGEGLKAYGCLLEGGENGSEITLLKKYLHSVQVANSPHPERVILEDFVKVSELPYLMRAMGYYPSETEISNMEYEINARQETDVDHNTVSFEKLVVLYLNYKPHLKLKFDEVRDAFNNMVLDANEINESFKAILHNIQNLGEKISPEELQIIFHTLLKTTDDISSDTSENNNLINTDLPLEFTFEEIMADLFGFQATKNESKE